MLINLMSGGNFYRLALMITVLGTFFIAFFALKYFMRMLPKDQGRQFAVNGALSEGKPRGAGIIMITAFTLCAALFVPLNAELLIYLILVYAAMLTGFLDDAAEKPWGELKKGLLDFIIAVGISANYIYHNGTEITIFGRSFEMPAALFGILGVILVWASINVTNCSDGVDGLCGSLFCVSLYSFMAVSMAADFRLVCVVMLVTAFAYLWFNCSPSRLLMGDAGSRAMGVFSCSMRAQDGKTSDVYSALHSSYNRRRSWTAQAFMQAVPRDEEVYGEHTDSDSRPYEKKQRLVGYSGRIQIYACADSCFACGSLFLCMTV